MKYSAELITKHHLISEKYSMINAHIAALRCFDMYSHVNIVHTGHNQNNQARAIALGNGEVREISNFHMDSTPLALLNFTINESPHACAIDVPADVEITMNAAWFVKRPNQPIGDCAQRVEVWTRYGQVARFCDVLPNSRVTLACSDFNTTYYARYVSEDTSVGVAFVIQFNGKRR